MLNGCCSPLWQKIRGILKRISTHLWAMISHLVRATQWSLTGQVNEPVLGMFGVSVTVTFGVPPTGAAPGGS